MKIECLKYTHIEASNGTKSKLKRHQERERDLEAGARGARDGLLLVLVFVLIFVFGAGGLPHYQTLGSFARHLEREIAQDRERMVDERNWG